MTIAYPIALPTVRNPARVTARMIDVVGEVTSPFTLAQETYQWPGQRWELDFEVDGMVRADAEAWIAWAAKLKGRHGSFLWGDSLGATARGAGGGSPLVNGGSQTGSSLVLDGAPTSTTGWLLEGDWIQLSSGSSRRLHKVLEDTDTDGSGNATLELWPDLRESPADNDPIVIASAQGRFKLATNMRQWTLEAMLISGLAFSAVEDLRPL